MYCLFKSAPYNTYEFFVIFLTHTDYFLKETRPSEHPKAADLETLP
jgi:hypothetical protein